MRETINAGEMHNVVYLLTKGPRQIEGLEKSHIVRQLSGEDLYHNVTALLPQR